MMKKITLAIFCLILNSVSIAQVGVGNGLISRDDIPFVPKEQYSYGQSIYYASEVGSSGMITGLTWFYSGSSQLYNSNVVDIYLGETEVEEFGAWIPQSELTKVLTSGTLVINGGLITVQLDTPFYYNGGGNLVVAVEETSFGNGDVFDTFFTFDDYRYRSRSISDASSPIDVPNLTAGGNVTVYTPNIVFDGISPCTTPNFEVDFISPYAAELSLDTSTASSWEVVVQESGGPTPTSGTIVTSFPYVADNLIPGISYDFYVRSVCDNGGKGIWSYNGSYDLEYCATGATEIIGNGVSNVTIGEASYPHSASTYGDYTGNQASIYADGQTTVSITHEAGPGWVIENHIWVDLNHNFQFENDEKLFFGSTSGSVASSQEIYDAVFSLPANTPAGLYRMRIVTSPENVGFDSCFSGDYGVSFDFDLNVLSGACDPPVLTQSIQPDCNNNAYYIDLNLSDLGNGTPTAFDGINSYPLSLGSNLIGPYVNGSSHSVIVNHGISVSCAIDLGTIGFICPPENDELAGAINLTPTGDQLCQEQSVSFTTNGATDSGLNSSCNSTIGRDVYYKWFATSPELLWVSTDSNIVIRDWQGTEIACSDTTSTDSILNGWNVGDELIFQIYIDEGQNQDAHFCLERYHSSFDNCYDPGRLEISNISSDAAKFSWLAPDLAESYNIEYGVSGFIQGTGTLVSDHPDNILYASNLLASTSYDVYVQTNCEASLESNWIGPVSFTTIALLPGDFLCNAIPLDVSPPGVSSSPIPGEYSNVGYSVQNDEPDTLCFEGGPSSTVWFSFVAPVSGQVSISTDVGGTLTDSEIAIYEAPSNCIELSTLLPAVACNQDGGITNERMAVLQNVAVTPDATYYIQVSKWLDTPEGTFGISVFDTGDSIISVVGTALNGWPSPSNERPDIEMSLIGEGQFGLFGQYFSDGEVKFRTNYDWSQPNWGGTTFPSGTFSNENIPVSEGFYDVIIDLYNNTYSFTPASETPTIGLIGSAANGWVHPVDPNIPTDIIMNTNDGVHYELRNQTLTNGLVKFRENYDWLVNWGSADFPTGTGVQNGMDIPVVADTYDIFFNRITGQYSFEINTVSIAPKIFLQGAMFTPNTGEEHLMRDDLRTAGIIPTLSPYSDALSCNASVFTMNGDDAIVDWVWIELRDGADHSILIDGKSALLQRDGDVVAEDGVSPVQFNVADGYYKIMLAHRLHLSVTSVNSYELSDIAAITDLSSSTNDILGGSNAVQLLDNGAYGMIVGDSDDNGQIQNTDIAALRPLLGTAGYNSSDLDMNGQTQLSDINNGLRPNLGKGEQN
ncbi:GEVED domain-containing protein [Sungkyunkwania multivorans]|uniref:GEVED domain-containing protein n=1 Tax=Sungkyunkwania multivorans TaxID=1173618 RepID=A0ABW3D3M0_9FLAO